MALTCDTSIKIKYKTLPLPGFSIYFRKEFMELLTTWQLYITVFLYGIPSLKKPPFQQWQQLSNRAAFTLNVAHDL